MITNFNEKNRKDDIKILCLLITIFFVIAWLCTPPGNKFAQICFYGNNTQFLIAKMTKKKEELEAWKFHRNNAVFLAKMERKDAALREIDKAIYLLPNYASEKEIETLYADRALIRLYFGETKDALDDYLRLSNPSIVDKFRIALLLKNKGHNKQALSYCNSILHTDPTAYYGYACIADVYASVGNYKTSVRVYDLLLDRTKNRAIYYVDRAEYRLKLGDLAGYNEDIKKAQELSPNIKIKSSVIEDILNPKKINLTIM